MATPDARPGRTRWLEQVGAIGAIVIPLGLLYSFFTADDYDDTSAALVAYAEDAQGDIWLTQILALLAPLLIGAFVAALWTRLRGAAAGYRALTLIGGTLFVAFLSVGLTLWSAPLIDSEQLSDAGAQAYIVFDDVGWVLLGIAGISIAAMIVGVSLAALETGSLPRWAAWVSFGLGVISLATVVAVGIFAWTLWLIAAGAYVLFGRERDTDVATPATDVA
jgi:hypothetical protein